MPQLLTSMGALCLNDGLHGLSIVAESEWLHVREVVSTFAQEQLTLAPDDELDS